LLTMGAGDIGGFVPRLISHLTRKPDLKVQS
jgi:hypothetical protein